MSDLSNTLRERGTRYGSFIGNARVSQNIKEAMERGANWDVLAPDQKEALEIIAHKIGRILNGDPNYTDSWHDIGGYAKLVEDRLNRDSFPWTEWDTDLVGHAGRLTDDEAKAIKGTLFGVDADDPQHLNQAALFGIKFPEEVAAMPDFDTMEEALSREDGRGLIRN